MIITGNEIVRRGIFTPTLEKKLVIRGRSAGPSYAGYDVRVHLGKGSERFLHKGDFLLATTVEHFAMPLDLLGVVHDKSTWARAGLSVFNTVIEPGWRGWLTLELVYHGDEPLHIVDGDPIAQVVLTKIDGETQGYQGKYADQEQRPVPPILEE